MFINRFYKTRRSHSILRFSPPPFRLLSAVSIATVGRLPHPQLQAPSQPLLLRPYDACTARLEKASASTTKANKLMTSAITHGDNSTRWKHSTSEASELRPRELFRVVPVWTRLSGRIRFLKRPLRSFRYLFRTQTLSHRLPRILRQTLLPSSVLLAGRRARKDAQTLIFG